MPSPVRPSDFCDAVPSPGADVCTTIKTIVFTIPRLLCTLVTYILNEDGTPSDEFLSDHRQVPAGSILDFAGLSAPSGWLLCDGRAVSRTTYADLFAVIGTIYGSGDGSASFNVPNLVSRFTCGASASDTDYTVGKTGGEETVQLLEGNIPPHLHTSSLPVVVKNLTPGSPGMVPLLSGKGHHADDNGDMTLGRHSDHIGEGDDNVLFTSIEQMMTELDEINGSTSASGHENRPPYIAFHKIIKT